MTPEHLYHDMTCFFAGHIRAGYKLVLPQARGDEFYFAKSYPNGLTIVVYPGLKLDARGTKKIVRKVIRLALKTPTGETVASFSNISHNHGIWFNALDQQIGQLQSMAIEGSFFLNQDKPFTRANLPNRA